jgi:hypothetical protein
VVGVAGMVLGFLIAVGFYEFFVYRKTDLPRTLGPATTAAPVKPPDLATPPTPAGSVPDPKGGKFSAGGVSFTYPKEWFPLDHVGYRFPQGNLRWVTAVGFDGSNFVAVGKYRYAKGKPNENQEFSMAESIVDDLTHQVEGGHLFRDMVGTTINGMHGYTFAMSGTMGGGVASVEDFDVVLFGDQSYYVIQCAMTSFTEGAVSYGCDMIVRNFRET